MSFAVLLFVVVVGVAFLLLVRSLACRNWLCNIVRNNISLPQSVKQSAKSKRSFPVRYSFGKYNLLRLIPWDAKGTLSETKDGFHFKGFSLMGGELELDFDSDESVVNYQKGRLWWDGGASWCVIETNGEKHYFTSESSELSTSGAGNDEAATTVMYENLTNRYIKLN